MSFERAVPPRVEITLALEQRPQVRIVCSSHAEELRIREHILRRPELWAIVDAALRLANLEEQAA